MIVRVIKYVLFLILLAFTVLTVNYNVSGEAYLPENYYEVAKEYTPKPEKHDLETLKEILMKVKLPAYRRQYFDCSEASSYLEWYLEGAGFHTYIGASLSLSHAWVVVELDNKEWVAIEPTLLMENNYNPPAIVECRDTVYYNPPKLYENPGQAISFVNDLKYPGYPKWTESEIDWWNSEPFASMEPFREWK